MKTVSLPRVNFCVRPVISLSIKHPKLFNRVFKNQFGSNSFSSKLVICSRHQPFSPVLCKGVEGLNVSTNSTDIQGKTLQPYIFQTNKRSQPSKKHNWQRQIYFSIFTSLNSIFPFFEMPLTVGGHQHEAMRQLTKIVQNYHISTTYHTKMIRYLLFTPHTLAEYTHRKNGL